MPQPGAPVANLTQTDLRKLLACFGGQNVDSSLDDRARCSSRSNGSRRCTQIHIALGCRVDGTQAFDLNTGLNETDKRCVADEQGAMAQLQTQFREVEKSQCIEEADIGGTPSYVDLLTCLQLAKDARQLPK